MAEDRSVAGEFYNSHEARKLAPADRVCEVCGVKLSRYNETLRCSLHKRSNILVKKTKRKL